MATLVVVEDEKILQKAMSIELLSVGHKVLTANNGEAGLKLIQEEKPDLVLLDLIMPKMGGFDVLKALKSDEKTKRIPVIILSNLSQDEDKKKALDLGAVDYYVKSSTDLSEMTKKIAAVLKV